ncbi:hypothetical protein LTS18_007024 [Coniosporium uncinatum]|uniref:Uncharacterized protein n=1 Tax=Coniosporium uncinatum TaxID=93489 RepID=A0ACC3DPG8_9PEZI|nr:hypothetical protein LTS18_007024 [Coniosporium uncinatum]
MDVFHIYTWSTAAWSAIQAAPLVVAPNMIIQLLSPEVKEVSILETYFSRSLGFSLLIVGLLTLSLSGALPLTSGVSSFTEAADQKAPYATATLMLTLAYHASAAFYMWTMYASYGSTGFIIGMIGSATLATAAMWCLMFGNDSHMSKRTGADKRTSNFPFKNAEAEKNKAGKRGL